MADDLSSDDALPRPRMRWPFYAAVAGFLVLLLVVGVTLLIVLFRDPLPPLTEADLDAAAARWARHGPADYDLDLALAGSSPGAVHIEVRGGVVTAMTRDGRVPTQRRTWDVWSVDGQFDTMRRELEMAADPEHEMNAPSGTRFVLRAQFDPRLGYPQRYRRIVIGQAPSVEWDVTRFQAR